MTNRRSAILILSACVFSFWFGQYTYVPYAAPYMTTLGAGATLVGFSTGIYGFFQMIVRVPLGLTSDRLGNRKVFIIVGSAFSLFSALGMYFFRSVWCFLLFRGLSGMASASWVAVVVLFCAYFKADEGAKAAGYLSAVNCTGKLLSYVVAFALVNRTGVPFLFLLAAGGALVSTVISFFVKDVKMTVRRTTADDIRAIIRNRSFKCYCVIGVFVDVVIVSTAFSFTSNLIKMRGFSDAMVGVLSGAFMLGTIISSVLYGSVLLPRLGVRSTFLFGFVLMGIYCFVLPFVWNVLLFLFLQLMVGIASEGMIAALMGLVNMDTHMPSELKSSAMGLFQTAYCFGMTVGPILIGSVIEIFGYTIGFFTAGSASAFAAAFALFMLTKTGTRPKKGQP